MGLRYFGGILVEVLARAGLAAGFRVTAFLAAAGFLAAVLRAAGALVERAALEATAAFVVLRAAGFLLAAGTAFAALDFPALDDAARVDLAFAAGFAAVFVAGLLMLLVARLAAAGFLAGAGSEAKCFAIGKSPQLSPCSSSNDSAFFMIFLIALLRPRDFSFALPDLDLLFFSDFLPIATSLY